MQRILITGACGFLGHHCVEHFIKETDWEIIVLDKLTYSANGFDRLRDISVFDDKRIRIFTVDLQEPLSEGIISEIGEVDYILNLASESHVDKSIENPVDFIVNNVKSTINMLELERKLKAKFIQFSTDESFGTAPDKINYKEGSRHNPSNPYAASKASQEDIARAYSHTYNLSINIVNSMNIIGERQHPEKFVPLCIKKIISGEEINIHSNTNKTKAGTRYYIHARNVAQALHFILEKTNERLDKIDASKGQFNIVGEKEIDNLSLAKLIAGIIGKEIKYKMVDFHESRPGHDLRYGLNGDKLKSMGFEYPKTLEQSLRKTIKWFIKPENKKWLK